MLRCLGVLDRRQGRGTWLWDNGDPWRGRFGLSIATGHGQFERERGALSWRAFHPNPTLMRFDNVTAHGEAQPGTSFAAGVGSALGGEERVENVMEFVRRYPAAVVTHDEVDHVGFRVVRQFDYQPTTAGHRLPSIDDQV